MIPTCSADVVRVVRCTKFWCITVRMIFYHRYPNVSLHPLPPFSHSFSLSHSFTFSLTRVQRTVRHTTLIHLSRSLSLFPLSLSISTTLSPTHNPLLLSLFTSLSFSHSLSTLPFSTLNPTYFTPFMTLFLALLIVPNKQ